MDSELWLTPCIYCGNIADSVDHVPPISARDGIMALRLTRPPRFIEVPSCRECNSALGNRALWTVTERKAWIKAWVRKRSRKYLVIPEWDKEDLGALGPNARMFVNAGLEKQRIVRQRLAW